MINYKHFIIIGAQRAGTTSLYGYLDAHPEISMAKPMRPEPKFFLDAKDGVSYNEYLEKVFSSKKKSASWLGEKSTSYHEMIETGALIKHVMPEVRLIMQLRNPVHRALSNYFFSRQHGLESRSLEEVFLEKQRPPALDFRTSVNPFNYVGRSRYSHYIESYLSIFNRDQLHVLVFEDWFSDHKKTADQLMQFLKLEKHSTQYNDLEKDFLNDSEKEPVLHRVVSELITELTPEIINLEHLLGRNLDVWKR